MEAISLWHIVHGQRNTVKLTMLKRATPGTDTWPNPAQPLDGCRRLGWLQRFAFLDMGDDVMWCVSTQQCSWEVSCVTNSSLISPMSATDAWGLVSWDTLSNVWGGVRLEWIFGRGDEKGNVRQDTTMWVRCWRFETSWTLPSKSLHTSGKLQEDIHVGSSEISHWSISVWTVMWGSMFRCPFDTLSLTALEAWALPRAGKFAFCY